MVKLKKWLVYLAGNLIAVVKAPVEWTLKQVKEYLTIYEDCDWSIELIAAS
jgi:hypothetical protein